LKDNKTQQLVRGETGLLEV